MISCTLLVLADTVRSECFKSCDLVRGLSRTFLALEISESFIHGAAGRVNFGRYIGACSDVH